MNNYDFKTLNDREFEAFASDVIGSKIGKKIERFKPGKDEGVDGRYFSSNKDEVILQCKHWANSPFSKLISHLEKVERPKLEKLKPSRYLLAVSNQLSRKNKATIAKIFAPYIKSDDDIFGAEDLNDLLSTEKAIELRHYKLWLHSSNVLSLILHHGILGRSKSSLEGIQEDAKKYAVTEHHSNALMQLEVLRVVVITGEPGVGKTTLANHLCIHYIAQGYDFIAISDDITQAEDVYDEQRKQIFYFDDFLGRNYLEALSGHEGKKITEFILRISKDANKKFVLTSRSTILNQGKLLIDLYSHKNLEKNEYELKIKSLTNLDRAKILYNHVVHSQLEPSYIEEIYHEKRYREVVKHRNFNPRLVSYVTDATRLDAINPKGYWNFITNSLDKPTAIWENPFVAQQDDFSRSIILITVLHRQPIDENYLAEIYSEFISEPNNQSMKGRRDFLSNIRTLTGSFLNRTIGHAGEVKIDLFNPSIADYVLSRYSADIATLRLAFSCIRNNAGLHTLKNLVENGIITIIAAKSITIALIKKLAIVDLDDLPISYVAEVFSLSQKLIGDSAAVETQFTVLVNCIFQRAKISDSLDDCFSAVEWGYSKKLFNDEEVLEFISDLASGLQSQKEIYSCYSLLEKISKSLPSHSAVVTEIEATIVDLVKDNLSDFVDIYEIFSDLEYGDYSQASEEITRELEKKLNKIGFSPISFDYEDLLEYYDLNYQMDEYFTNDSGYEGSASPKLNESTDFDIDDIFDRS